MFNLASASNTLTAAKQHPGTCAKQIAFTLQSPNGQRSTLDAYTNLTDLTQALNLAPGPQSEQALRQLQAATTTDLTVGTVAALAACAHVTIVGIARIV